MTTSVRSHYPHVPVRFQLVEVPRIYTPPLCAIVQDRIERYNRSSRPIPLRSATHILQYRTCHSVAPVSLGAVDSPADRECSIGRRFYLARTRSHTTPSSTALNAICAAVIGSNPSITVKPE